MVDIEGRFSAGPTSRLAGSNPIQLTKSLSVLVQVLLPTLIATKASELHCCDRVWAGFLAWPPVRPVCLVPWSLMHLCVLYMYCVLYSESAYTLVANLDQVDDKKTKFDYFRTVFLILYPKYQMNF